MQKQIELIKARCDMSALLTPYTHLVTRTDKSNIDDTKWHGILFFNFNFLKKLLHCSRSLLIIMAAFCWGGIWNLWSITGCPGWDSSPWPCSYIVITQTNRSRALLPSVKPNDKFQCIEFVLFTDTWYQWGHSVSCMTMLFFKTCKSTDQTPGHT